MLYNKNQYRKTNDKKVLHKIGKHWVAISVATLMALGAGAVSTVHANASTNAGNGVKVTSNANVSPRGLADKHSASVKSSNANSNVNASNSPKVATVSPVNVSTSENKSVDTNAQGYKDALSAYYQNVSNKNVGVNENKDQIYAKDGSTNKSSNEPKTSIDNEQVHFTWINDLLKNKSSDYQRDANNFLAKQAVQDAESGKWNGTNENQPTTDANPQDKNALNTYNALTDALKNNNENNTSYLQAYQGATDAMKAIANNKYENVGTLSQNIKNQYYINGFDDINNQFKQNGIGYVNNIYDFANAYSNGYKDNNLKAIKFTNDIYNNDATNLGIGDNMNQPGGNNGAIGSKDLVVDGQNHIADLHAMHISPGTQWNPNAQVHLTIQNFRKLYGSDIYGPVNEWNNNNKNALLTYRNVNYEGSQLSHSNGIGLEIDGVVNANTDEYYNSPYESNVEYTDGGTNQQNLEIASMTVDDGATFNGTNNGGDCVDVLGGDLEMKPNSNMRLNATIGQANSNDRQPNGGATALYVQSGGSINIEKDANLTANGTTLNNLGSNNDNNVGNLKDYRDKAANAIVDSGDIMIDGGKLNTTINGNPEFNNPVDITGTVNIQDNGTFQANGSNLGSFSGDLIGMNGTINLSKKGNLYLTEDRPNTNNYLLYNTGNVNIENPGNKVMLGFTNDSNHNGTLFFKPINAYSVILGEGFRDYESTDDMSNNTPEVTKNGSATPFYKATITNGNNIAVIAPSDIQKNGKLVIINPDKINNSNPSNATSLEFNAAPSVDFEEQYPGNTGDKAGFEFDQNSLNGTLRLAQPDHLGGFSAPVYVRINVNRQRISNNGKFVNALDDSNTNNASSRQQNANSVDDDYTLEFVPLGNNQYQEYDGAGKVGSPITAKSVGDNATDLPFNYGISGLAKNRQNSVKVTAHYSVNTVEQELYDDGKTPNNVRMHESDINQEDTNTQNQALEAKNRSADEIIDKGTTIANKYNIHNFDNNVNNASNTANSASGYANSASSANNSAQSASSVASSASNTNKGNADLSSASSAAHNDADSASSAYSQASNDAKSASSYANQARSAYSDASNNSNNFSSDSNITSSDNNSANSLNNDASNEASSANNFAKSASTEASKANSIINSLNGSQANSYANDAHNQYISASSEAGSSSVNGNADNGTKVDSHASEASSASNDIHNIGSLANASANSSIASYSNDAGHQNSIAQNEKSLINSITSSVNSNRNRASSDATVASNDAGARNISGASNADNDAKIANTSASSESKVASNDEDSASNAATQASNDAASANSVSNSVIVDNNTPGKNANSASVDASQANSDVSSANSGIPINDNSLNSYSTKASSFDSKTASLSNYGSSYSNSSANSSLNSDDSIANHENRIENNDSNIASNDIINGNSYANDANSMASDTSSLAKAYSAASNNESAQNSMSNAIKSDTDRAYNDNYSASSDSNVASQKASDAKRHLIRASSAESNAREVIGSLKASSASSNASSASSATNLITSLDSQKYNNSSANVQLNSDSSVASNASNQASLDSSNVENDINSANSYAKDAYSESSNANKETNSASQTSERNQASVDDQLAHSANMSASNEENSASTQASIADSAENNAKGIDNSLSSSANKGANADANAAGSDASKAASSASNANQSSSRASSASSDASNANTPAGSIVQSANQYHPNSSDQSNLNSDSSDASSANNVAHSASAAASNAASAANSAVKSASDAANSASSAANRGDKSAAAAQNNIASDASNSASSDSNVASSAASVASSAAGRVHSDINNARNIVNSLATNHNDASQNANLAGSAARKAASDASSASSNNNSASRYASEASSANNDVKSLSDQAKGYNNSSTDNSMNSDNNVASSANNAASSASSAAASDNNIASNVASKARSEASVASSAADHGDSNAAKNAVQAAISDKNIANNASNSASQSNQLASSGASAGSSAANNARSIVNSLAINNHNDASQNASLAGSAARKATSDASSASSSNNSASRYSSIASSANNDVKSLSSQANRYNNSSANSAMNSDNNVASSANHAAAIASSAAASDNSVASNAASKARSEANVASSAADHDDSIAAKNAAQSANNDKDIADSASNAASQAINSASNAASAGSSAANNARSIINSLKNRSSSSVAPLILPKSSSASSVAPKPAPSSAPRVRRTNAARITNRNYPIQYNYHKSGHDVVIYSGRKYKVHYHNNGKNTIQAKVGDHYKTIVVSRNLPTPHISAKTTQQIDHVNFKQRGKLVITKHGLLKAIDKAKPGEVINYRGHKFTIVAVPNHFRYFMVKRSILAHMMVMSVGSVTTRRILKSHHHLTIHINRILGVHGKHANYVRYEINVDHHNFWVTGRDDYVPNAYYQKSDFNAKHARHIKVIRSCRLYTSHHYNHHTFVKNLPKGKVLHVKKVIFLGAKGNYQTRLLLSNGDYVTANKNWVKIC